MKYETVRIYGIILAIICLIIDIRIGLIVSTLIFAIFSFLLIKKMTTRHENYTYINPCDNSKPFQHLDKKFYPLDDYTQHTYAKNKDCKNPLSEECYKFNNDPFKTKPVIVNKHMKSINNELQGGANPKTLISPMVVMPSYSLGWRANDMVVPNILKNKRTNEDLYLSGYLSSEDSNIANNSYNLNRNHLNDNKQLNKHINKHSNDNAYNNNTRFVDQNFAREENFGQNFNNNGQNFNNNGQNFNNNGQNNGQNFNNNGQNFNNQNENEVVEEFGYSPVDYTSQNWSDAVDTSNGYNPKQWPESKFPANLPQGVCAQQPEFSKYHNKLFTSNVQPGVSYRDDVIEPINSNIGISFQQEFLPRTFEYSEDGNLLDIVDHDPRFAPPSDPIIGEPIEPIQSNVYDPRFTGYGTGYRTYVDSMTGQPRFPYDDVNAIRMPNYIVRSKIDTHDFADKYGPSRVPQSLNSVREQAQDAFMTDTNGHRNDMMSKLMRKRNAELWQLRQAPVHNSAGRMLGGKF